MASRVLVRVGAAIRIGAVLFGVGWVLLFALFLLNPMAGLDHDPVRIENLTGRDVVVTPFSGPPDDPRRASVISDGPIHAPAFRTGGFELAPRDTCVLMIRADRSAGLAVRVEGGPWLVVEDGRRYVPGVGVRFDVPPLRNLSEATEPVQRMAEAPDLRLNLRWWATMVAVGILPLAFASGAFRFGRRLSGGTRASDFLPSGARASVARASVDRAEESRSEAGRRSSESPPPIA